MDGFSGEQFADPDAIQPLGRCRDLDAGQQQTLTVVAATDPLNLTGVLLPGERVPANSGSRVAFGNGLPVAALIGGEVRSLTGDEIDWATRQKLVRVGGGRLQRKEAASAGIARH